MQQCCRLQNLREENLIQYFDCVESNEVIRTLSLLIEGFYVCHGLYFTLSKVGEPLEGRLFSIEKLGLIVVIDACVNIEPCRKVFTFLIICSIDGHVFLFYIPIDLDVRDVSFQDLIEVSKPPCLLSTDAEVSFLIYILTVLNKAPKIVSSIIRGCLVPWQVKREEDITLPSLITALLDN